MCNANIETVRRATERMCAGRTSGLTTAVINGDEVQFTTRYNGKTFKDTIKTAHFSEAYSKALAMQR